MKKLFISLLLISTIISCKKSNPTPSPVPTPKTDDSTKVILNDSVPCLENSFISFLSNGAPLGKFGPCIKDIDGNIYKTVMIGEQYWMAENLKVTRYNDGTDIPNVSDDTIWGNLKTPSWCYYDNDTVNNKYGKLYNEHVVNYTTNGDKNVCPIGWHVPTRNEWHQLIVFLGDSLVAGSKMKEIGDNKWGYNESNSSLFTAIPSGYRITIELNGTKGSIFLAQGLRAIFWSSDKNSSRSKFFTLRQGMEFIGEEEWNLNFATTIRCIKD